MPLRNYESMPAAIVRRQNRAITFLGLAALVSGLRFWLDPASLDASSVGRALPGPFDEVWSSLYVVGGVLLIIGAQRPAPRVELPGVTLLLTALVVNFGGIVAERGIGSLAQVPVYAAALWVLLGRRADLVALGDRRVGLPDPRPPAARTERRRPRKERSWSDRVPPAAMIVPPLAASSTAETILVALIGGGLVSALVQALMYRPQSKDLLSRATDAATAAADRMLARQRQELTAAYGRIDALEEELAEARAEADAARREVASAHRRIAGLERRLAALETGEHDLPGG